MFMKAGSLTVVSRLVGLVGALAARGEVGWWSLSAIYGWVGLVGWWLGGLSL
ncbi:MAG: hypothetical protein ACPGWR_19010 [Ardenticatenaceae bacterium]